MTFDHESLPLLAEALATLEGGFGDLPPVPPNGNLNALRATLQEVAMRMRDNFPYQHPLYVGQMLKPPHAVARLAYALAMYVNPNNHALDGGRATSAMEKEAVAQIAGMFGWSTPWATCAGGTMAISKALVGRASAGQGGRGVFTGHYTLASFGCAGRSLSQHRHRPHRPHGPQ